MQKVTFNQIELANTTAQSFGLQKPEFEAGVSIQALHEWALNALITVSMEYVKAQTIENKKRLRYGINEIKLFILTEVF